MLWTNKKGDRTTELTPDQVNLVKQSIHGSPLMTSNFKK